jgi:hypothetical protein
MTGEAQVLLIISAAVGGVTAYGRYLRHLRDMAMIEQGMDPRTTPAGQPSLSGALTIIAVGLALTLGMGTIGFGPWLLAGLIPLFIGLARLLAMLLQGQLPVTSAEDKGADHGA